MRKRIIDAISFTGIWTCPITYFLIFECFNELYKRSIIITPLLERAILMLGLLPMMWIAYVNILSYEKDDKRCFNLGVLFVTLFDTPIVSLNDTVILSNRHSSQNH